MKSEICCTYIYFCVFVFQVSGGEDTDKLQAVLGDYKNVASLIMRAPNTNSLMGVERQPATPLPSGKFFPNKSNNHKDRGRDLSRHFGSSVDTQSAPKFDNRTQKVSGQQGQVNTKVKPSNVTNSSASNSSRASYGDDKSSLGKSHRPDHVKSGSQSSASTPKTSSSSNSQKLPKPDLTNQSVKKEVPVSQSTKHPPVSSREPVLQSLNQEFIGQSRSDGQKSNTKPVSSSENKFSDGSRKFDSVLKEKEENRNTNSSRNKNRPKIHIPEVRHTFNCISYILRNVIEKML